LLGTGGYELQVHTGDKVIWVDVDDPILDAVEELRDKMAIPNGGTWYTAIFTVNGDGSYKTNFDYDSRPQWDVSLDPTSERTMIIEDYNRYPRSPEATPDWLKEILSPQKDTNTDT
jgi:hypothetical protein